MAKVRVEPLGVEVDAHAGETLMAAAVRHGLDWPTVCGGQGQCTVCYVLIDSGTSHLSPPKPRETAVLSLVCGRHPDRPKDAVRLACQAVVTGDVTVVKRGVRRRPA